MAPGFPEHLQFNMSEEKKGSIVEYTAEQIKALQDKNQELSDANATLKSERDDLKVSSEKLQKDLDVAHEEIGNLSSLLDAQEGNAKHGVKVVLIGKQKYKLLGNKFVTPKGKVYSADELAQDKDELKRMLKIESGSLVAITD